MPECLIVHRFPFFPFPYFGFGSHTDRVFGGCEHVGFVFACNCTVWTLCGDLRVPKIIRAGCSAGVRVGIARDLLFCRRFRGGVHEGPKTKTNNETR